MKLYRNKNGEKLYPVCKWEPNQHKLYNAYDRALNRRDDENYSEASCEWVEKVESALNAFDAHIVDGIVYATWKEGAVIKDLIAAYDIRADINYFSKKY